jgi:phage terminase large subunit
LSEIEARFPKPLKFLFQPARYKVARGGRGSGKSWGFARALLILGAEKPLRILCVREVQKSIQDSVYQLLLDQIKNLGMEAFYSSVQTEVRGINGTTFRFSGLSELTSDQLKSFEGVDKVWCEEAHTISPKSWNVLIPTIRKEESEIWVTFNPELESDETYKRFVTNPPPDCVSILMNYNDNPWFPKVLELERIHAEETMKAEEYAHIWEGRCKPAVEGAIYFDEVAKAETSGHICNVPYDPLLKVQAIWDLGWNDAMTIILAQKSASAIHIIGYIEDNRRTYDSYMSELKELKYNWGSHYLPHDGFSSDPKSGTTAAKILEKHRATVQQTPSLSIEDGIKLARMSFGRLYFDKEKTNRLVECLKRYRRNINKSTDEGTTPRHDEFSHGADALRYLCIAADSFTNEEWGKKIIYSNKGIV